MSAIIIRSEAQRQVALKLLNSLDLSKEWEFSVKRHAKKRSLSQNALYFKWCGIIAEETGNDAEAVHEAFKAKFLAPKQILGENVTPSTKKLSTVDFSAFCEQVYAFATSQLGILLPVPEEAHLR